MRASDWVPRIFSATLIAIGAYGLISVQFVAFWVPLVPAPPQWKWIIGTVTLLGGLGLLQRKAGFFAAPALLAILVIWLARFKAPAIFAAPLTAGSWESAAETVAIAAGLLCFLKSSHAALVARLLLGLAMCAFGAAHFAYLAQTAALVPQWLPAHVLLVYLTGAVFAVSGIGLILGMAARGFAILVAIQMGFFTVLVWLPRILAGIHDVSTVSECLDSAALAAVAAVVARNIGRGSSAGASSISASP